jgi:hypothetical protein
MANVKTLTQAIPTVQASTGFVTQWLVTVNVSESGPDSFNKDYPFPINISVPSKAPEAYTANEIIGLFPANLDAIFAHHKEVFTSEHTPTDSTVNDFDLGNLSSGQAAKNTK